MGDADETYPIAELAPFVERLAAGDDLVMGSRFEGTIHGEAMPWLNRHVGNPILTGHAQPLLRREDLGRALRDARRPQATRSRRSTSTRPGWSSRRRWSSRPSAASSA